MVDEYLSNAGRFEWAISFTNGTAPVLYRTAK